MRSTVAAITVLAVLAPPQGAAAQEAVHPAIALSLDAPDVIIGETPVHLTYALRDAAHVLIFRIDTDGRVRVLSPHAPAGDTVVPAGGPYMVSRPRASTPTASFVVDEYPGVGYVFAVASRVPFSLGAVTYRERWNRHALAEGGRVRGDPYVAFAALLDRVLPADTTAYAIDVVPYAVGSRHDVPRFACYGCHDSSGYPWQDDYRAWCATFEIELHQGPWAGILLPLGVRAAWPAAIFVYTRRANPPSTPRAAAAARERPAPGLARGVGRTVLDALGAGAKRQRRAPPPPRRQGEGGTDLPRP